tara:strand:- start:1391 stop:1831 length:441 start_codon:yes stop_codon:yes gene_type:complete
MKRSERFRKFSEISSGLENNAGAKLAASQTQLDAQKKQLGELKTYLGEYQTQLQAKLNDSNSALVINGYQQFISSLNGAIALQTEIVRKGEGQVEELRKAWIEKRIEVSKYDQAADNFRLQEDAQRNKAEQAENDDRISSNYHSGK